MRIKLGIIRKHTLVGRAIFDALPELAQWALVAKYHEPNYCLGDLRT